MFASSRPILLTLAVLGLAVAAYFWFVAPLGVENKATPEVTFTETVVVPTLDTPIPASKSAIWCASFQLAWNRLKNDVVKEPIRLKNAQEVADRLNKAEVSENDLEKGSYYAAAGLVADGITEKIKEDMHERFPGVEVPEFDDSLGLVSVAFAYLKAEIRFKHRYEETNGMRFHSEVGSEPRVQASGILFVRGERRRQLRDQVRVLFDDDDTGQFAIDVDIDSRPNQLILSRIARKGNLADTLETMNQKIKTRRDFGSSVSTLLFPEMRWSTTHHFEELEGKALENAGREGNYLSRCMQMITFRLDSVGAIVESTAKGEEKKSESRPRDFHFDRPFLLIMKKRDAEQPFLVIWVANAELLQKLGQ